MAARVLPDEAFTARICVDWARRMGIHFDLDRLIVRTVADAGFTGRGVYLTKPAEAGEFFAVIPQTATLQAPDLMLSTRRYFADLATQAPASLAMPPACSFLADLDSAGNAAAGGMTCACDTLEERDMAEAFGRGFQVVARGADTPFDELPMVGLLDSTRPAVPVPRELPDAHAFRSCSLPPLSGEERDWWQLAMVVALERRRGAKSPWHDYLRFALPQRCLMDVSGCFEHQFQLLVKGRLPSPETTMKPPERNESPLIAPLSPAAFSSMRQRVHQLELVRSAYAWRFAALFNRNLETVATSRGYSGLQPTLMRPSDLRWAMDMVASRANNFSFYQSTEAPRPYGVSPEPIPGAVSTLAPFFDLLNHSMSMNVLVADVRLGPGGGDDSASSGTRRDGMEWTETAPTAGAGLVLASLTKMDAGDELCYIYNAPVVRHEHTGVREVDVAGCIARWGFLPPPPLT